MSIMSGRCGPSGGKGGTSAGFYLDALGVSRIRVWGGDYVNAIEVTDLTGTVHVFGNTATGTLTGDITLQPGEFILGIEGFCGDYVNTITIYTSTTRSVSAGNGGPAVAGLPTYNYLFNGGLGITGFFGNAGDWIDSIGVWFSSQYQPNL